MGGWVLALKGVVRFVCRRVGEKERFVLVGWCSPRAMMGAAAGCDRTCSSSITGTDSVLKKAREHSSTVKNITWVWALRK